MQDNQNQDSRTYCVRDSVHPLKYVEAPRPDLNFDHGLGLTGLVKGLYHALLYVMQAPSSGEVSRSSSSSSLNSDDASYDTPTQSPRSTDAFPSLHTPSRVCRKMRRSKESLSSLSSLSSFSTHPESPTHHHLAKACPDSASGDDYGHFFDFRDRFDDSVLTAGPKSGTRPPPIHEE